MKKEFVTFYRLNSSEREIIDNNSEKQIKLLLQKNAELEERIKYLEAKINFYENKPKNIEPADTIAELYSRSYEKYENSERLFYNVGEVVKFGSYQWIVIEASKEKALLLCKKCVREIGLFEAILSAKVDSFLSKNLRYNSIREWLNEGFYYAFKTEEKEKIIKTKIDESDDYFFILSKDELYNAVNNLDINLFRFLEDELWWLRNSENEKELCIVNNDKIEISNFGLRYGIRPAVYIKNQK